MRKLMLLVGVAAVTVSFTACSNDQVVENSGQLALTKGTGINFSPMVNKSTRSTVVNTAPQLGSFAVSAFWGEAITSGKIDNKQIYVAGKPLTGTFTAGAAYDALAWTEGTGADATSGTISGLKNTKIVYKNGGWDYDNAEAMAYWPFRTVTVDKEYAGDVPLDFVAISPASAATSDLAIAGSIANYEVKDVVDQEDLCYAVNKGKTQKDGVVNMYFKHALSQMIFKAKMGAGMKVTIKSIEIMNLKNKGTYNLPAATVAATEAGEASQGAWSSLDATSKATYAGFTAAAGYIAIPDSSAGNEAYATQLTGANQEIIFMPQEAKPAEIAGNQGTAWSSKDVYKTGDDIPTGKSAGDAIAPKDAKNIVLKIVCKASRGGTALLGSCVEGAVDEYATRYFPLNTEWLQGKKYIYTLLFGGVSDPENPGGGDDNPGDDNPGGYDEDGKVVPPTVPITFSASVEDWTEVRNNVVF